MQILRFLPLVMKYVTRYRGRSLLTVGGVATAMFLFYSVQAMYQGVKEATHATSADTRLVVYRQDRYCPYSSNLPQDYANRIAAIEGVKTVVPVKVAVNNCRTSLDVVTFRGVPVDAVEKGAFGHVKIINGSLEDWKRRSDAALLGDRLAARRGLKVGDRVDLAGITIYIAGIIHSPEAQDQAVAYGHLDFVQRASDNKVGIVTQFNVTVAAPDQMNRVAKVIDAEFRDAAEPTATWPEKTFVARAASDIVEIVGFARWLGWACVAGVFALVFNAIVLSVQDRVRDHAIMQTLGYSESLIAKLIIGESLVLSLSGALIGLVAAAVVTSWANFSFSVEGLSIHVRATVGSVGVGLALSLLTGIIAGLVPAWQASRHDIAACFRAA
ncbi:MAG: FtsX-like permease family protein [Thermodesulfobacteriota bacterium]